MNNFLIISCTGKNDKLGLKINKEFFIRNLFEKKNLSEDLVEEISNFTKECNVNIDKNFSVIVNQGPGSFSGIRVSIAIAKGLEISKKVKIFGYNGTDLKVFDKENVEKLVNSNLIEKKLIKPVYLS
jgi:tRNA A37 threonylcarbamoyladenosine modification protein TsaB